MFAHHEQPDAELQLHPYTVSCSGFLFEDCSSLSLLQSPPRHMQFLSLGSWGAVLCVVLWHQECGTNFHKAMGLHPFFLNLHIIKLVPQF